MEVTQYLVDCCVMQNDTTPEAFVGMTRAYYWATKQNNKFLSLSDLRIMNSYIRNFQLSNWRTIPVHFPDGSFAPDASNVRRLMEQWKERFVTYHNFVEVDMAYFELMRIHPFVDGNGRVGSLYWNHQNGTLLNPEHPPKYEDLKERYSTSIGAEMEK